MERGEGTAKAMRVVGRIFDVIIGDAKLWHLLDEREKDRRRGKTGTKRLSLRLWACEGWRISRDIAARNRASPHSWHFLQRLLVSLMGHNASDNDMLQQLFVEWYPK